MAPEQVTGDALGPYTDLYAVGVIAYELLSGHPPFNTGTPPVAVLYRHVHTPPPPLAELAPDAPPAVCSWVEWLLEKDPVARPPSAATATEALEEIAVAELGPYWRRDAAITPDEAAVPTLSPETPTTAAHETPPTLVATRPRRRALVAGAVLVAAGAAAVIVLVTANSGPARNPAARKAAAPYDFDGNGRQELVLGMPGSGPSGAGIVATWDGRRASTLLTAQDAHVRTPLNGREGFGTSLASSDFNRDGYADLAVSVPGRELVIVIYGSHTGLKGGRVRTIGTSEMRLPTGSGRFGSRLVGADFNEDGYGDLVVGAPGADPDGPSSGSLQILFGGARGIRPQNARLLPRPVGTLAQFGTKLRAGDVDGDGHLDLVEGAPDAPAGHLGFCRGSATGPRRCRTLGGAPSMGTSALAVADVNGDGRDDIIQGDHIDERAAQLGLAPSGGEIRIWRGRRGGPARQPLTLTQGSADVPGSENSGDGFGFTVDAADLDGDGYADIVAGVPADDGDEGSVAIIRGGRNGYARGLNTRFYKGHGVPGVRRPGDRLGWAVSALDVTGDDRIDVAASVPGAERPGGAVFVLERTKGGFAPDETRVVWPLRHVPDVRTPAISSIRIGRADER